MTWKYIVILVASAASFTTKVVGEECEVKTRREMVDIMHCCKIDWQLSEEIVKEVEQAVKSCQPAMNTSSETGFAVEFVSDKYICRRNDHYHNPHNGEFPQYRKGPYEAVPDGYECMHQCIFTKLGILGEDKAIERDAALKLMGKALLGDFNEPAVNALGLCLDESNAAYASCPDGLELLSRCFIIKLYLDCPQQYWTESETCSEGKNYVKKCGTMKFP